MPIKKRSTLPTAAQEAEARKPAPLNIVAKPKQPVPEGGMLRAVYGAEPTAQQARRLGLVAIDCNEPTADANLTIEDRVSLMRINYDQANPQETRYRGRVRNRGTAITAMCITCTGGRKAVTECIDTTCPLWAFRLGGDPFFGRKK